MYTTLEERARALERILVRLEGDMVERANLGGMEVSAVGVPRQESVLNIGRVRAAGRRRGDEGEGGQAKTGRSFDD